MYYTPLSANEAFSRIGTMVGSRKSAWLLHTCPGGLSYVLYQRETFVRERYRRLLLGTISPVALEGRIVEAIVCSHLLSFRHWTYVQRNARTITHDH
jgi:hypothetical protein